MQKNTSATSTPKRNPNPNPDPKAEKAFKAADSDGDCRLSRQEWVAKFGDDKLFDA